jgi:type VI secretion system secreted protein VgrG
MLPTTESPFSLVVAGGVTLRVHGFSGHEALSRPHRFDVRVSSELEPALVRGLVGQRATLLALVHGVRRAAPGVIEAVKDRELDLARGEHTFRVRLVSELALLRRGSASRVYQGETAPAIARRLLEARGLSVEVRLARPHLPKTYCVQYRESDLDFVRRILAEDGVHLTFEPPSALAALDPRSPAARGRHVLVDDASGYVPLPSADGDPGDRMTSGATLTYHPGHALRASGEAVLELERSQRLVVESVHVRDYDYERPLRVPEARYPEHPAQEGGLARLEPAHLYEPAPTGHDVRADEHEARALGEGLARDRALATGRASSARLHPGCRFTLLDPPDGEPAREWVVIEVRHRAHGPSGGARERPLYEARFTVAPAETWYAPRRPERPRVEHLHTGVVVGPRGESIHTDSLGRVRVELHWDLEGRRDERSSAWLRVAQGWQGAGFGLQFVPRVGMEVLVGFLGGDVDRPVVQGCLPNRINAPAFPLPDEREKSGLRTQSSPGATGYHELSFDDASGRELVRLRSQRDLELEALGRRTDTTRGDALALVHGAYELRADGAASLVFGAGRIERVDGVDHKTVTGPLEVNGDGDASLELRGSARVATGLDTSVRADGALTLEAARAVHLSAEHDLTLEAGSPEAPSTLALSALGTLEAGATGELRLRSDHGIVLVCGESQLRLTPERIELRAPKVHVVASDEAFVSGKKQALELRDGAELRADSARVLTARSNLVLEDGRAHLQGSTIALVGPGSREGSDERGHEPDARLVRWVFLDERHRPLADKHAHVLVRGERLVRTTDGDGALSLRIPRDSSKVRVRLWYADYPKGPSRLYDMLVADELPDAMTPDGARARLYSLGYDVGPDVTSPWDALRDAVVRFQKKYGAERGLVVSGELDRQTLEAIREVYGE